MNDITPNSAVMELTKLSRQLDDTSFKLREAERDAVNKRHRFTIEFQKAILAAEGAAQQRTAQATVATADERLSAELAEAELRILRATVRTIESRIEVGRSVVGVLRAEAQVVR